MRDGRWTTVTPSEYEHERRALEYLRKRMPDADPYRAWSNFTYTAASGHIDEIDFLIATRAGLYLVEIKSLTGKLGSSGSDWVQTRKTGSVRRFANPVHLADAKSKRLKGLLIRAAAKHGYKGWVPRVEPAVFLSEPGLDVRLADHHRQHVYGTDQQSRRNTLPDVWTDLLGRAPQDSGKAIGAQFSGTLPALLNDIGIARSATHRQVGSWELSTPPIEEGPTWQDHLAQHVSAPAEKRRVRLYLVERGQNEEARTVITRAAEREMVTLHGIDHSGIVQVDALEEHEAGPALVFRHDPDSMALDSYMAAHGQRLDMYTRLDMVRQLIDAVDYAHRRKLHHRALSARSVLVTPRRRRGRDEDSAWLHPELRIGNWQIATRAALRTAELHGFNRGVHRPQSSPRCRGGFRANATLAASLSSLIDGRQRFTDTHLRLRPDVTRDMWQAATAAASERLSLPEVDASAVSGLKFGDALPPRLAEATLARRLADLDAAQALLRESQVFSIEAG